MGEDALNKQVASRVDFKDLLMAGATKAVLERVATPVIGNGTLKSGAIKLGVAYIFGNQLPEFVRLGVAVDGTEDVVFSLMGLLGGLGGEAQSGGSELIV